MGLDVFDVSSPPPLDSARGIYVALSGNTSAGKSSLIETLDSRAREAGLPSVGVSERLFHDRYLQLMFSQPGDFAFPIQVSFMLQRHLILLRNLQLGRLVFLERAHFDDGIFVLEHLDQGHISAAEHDAYQRMATVFHAKIPVPDILVLMNPSPEVSLRRLNEAEESGKRPHEFPNESSKKEWVHRWHEYYVDLHDHYRARAANDPTFAGVRLIEVDPESSTEGIASEVFRVVESVANRDLQCQ